MREDEPNNNKKSRYTRSAYIWNTINSGLNALQNVIMLMAIMRTCDLMVAGVFTFAFVNAHQFRNIGTYGMRNFQASDVRPQYGFNTYARSRIITCLFMIACSIAFIIFSSLAIGYTLEKTAACILMIFYALLDTVEDVFDGNYQQHGRLDIAGKLSTARISSNLIVFIVSVVLTHDLVIALSISVLYGAMFLFSGLLIVKRLFGLPIADNGSMTVAAKKSLDIGVRLAESESVCGLLRDCFPLFIAAFLLFYLGNAPKYSIDIIMNDNAQAIYGFIAMPVFVVGLLAQFVYMPLVEPLSLNWQNNDKHAFSQEFIKQCGVIILITIVCDIAALLFGVPVLNWLYATDVGAYLVELIVLVTGGAFYAMANLFIMGITIMRIQKKLVIGYAAVSCFALFASQPFVACWGISGAAWTYFICMMILAIWFAILFFTNIHE